MEDHRKINVGETIRFTATVEDFPELLEIEWTLNGKPIVGDNVLYAKEGSTYILEVTDAKPHQSGILECSAKTLGSTKHKLELIVKEVGIAPTFARNLKDQLVEEHKPLIMEAKLASGIKPKAKIQWLRDGQPLELNGRWKFEQGLGGVLKLLIEDVTLEDSASVTCQAVNKYGRAECSANIAVQKCRS